MHHIIKILFPFKLQLHIFQLEHYSIVRFLHWYIKNPWLRSHTNKKPLIVTQKVSYIQAISFVIFGLSVIATFASSYSIIFITITTILVIHPWILISVSLIILSPYEYYNKKVTIERTREKIKRITSLKVIGIAGSYGKTSVKNILYHLLTAKFRVLKTPLSYNTIFGISQVVDLELDDSYDFFLCELGEFVRGDIIELSNMTSPTYGVITGINDQHLERLKNIKNTRATIFEIVDYLKSTPENIWLNGSSSHILDEIFDRKLAHVNIYGTSSGTTRIEDIKFSDTGTYAVLVHNNKHYPIHTQLLGYAHLNNIIGAVSVALSLNVSIESIIEGIATLPLVSHRFAQSVTSEGMLLIDNSYSSNSTSFEESLKALKDLPRSIKILVTPGIVELGSTTAPVHESLGILANKICDYVILVGKNERTLALSKNISSSKVVFIEKIEDMRQKLHTLPIKLSDTVVVIENDLPDNY